MILHRHFVRIAVLLAVVVTGSACDSGERSVETGEADISGLAVTNPRASDLVPLPGGEVVVVDGLFDSEDGRTTRVWYPAEGEYVSYSLDGVPLAGLGAWWDGDEVVVIGHRCPEWSIDTADTGDEISSVDLCGVEQRSAIAFDPAKVEWRVVSDDLDVTLAGTPASTATSGEALLLGSDSGALFDTDTGELTALSGLPDDRQLMRTMCGDGSGALAVVFDSDTAAAPDTSETSVYRLQGSQWEPVELGEPLEPSTGAVGCLGAQVVIVQASMAGLALKKLTLSDQADVSVTELPSPPLDDFPTVDIDDGGSLIAWTDAEERADSKSVALLDDVWKELTDGVFQRARSILVNANGAVITIPDAGVAPTQIEDTMTTN